MKTFEIILGKSVGDINLGMPRDNVRQLLGEYREFNNNLIKMNSYDQFAFCNIGYDQNNNVDFISIFIFKNIELTLENKSISNMSSLELFSFIYNMDKSVDLENGGVSFENNKLGFAAFFEKEPALTLSTNEEIFYEKLKAITVTVPEYWRKNK